MYYICSLAGIGIFLWVIMNLPFTKSDIKKWIVKLKTEIFPDQKRQRKELYHKFMIKFYPDYVKLKEQNHNEEIIFNTK